MNGMMLARRIERRSAPAEGIRIAKDYWADSGLYGDRGLPALGAFDEYRGELPAEFFKQVSFARGRHAGELVKELRRKLTYSDGRMGVKEVTPSEQQTLAATKGACMDFACVITTTRQDRDGDVLECDGADIDPRSPLLWQHMPVYPIGKLVAILSRNSKRITGHLAIIDNAMGRDTAQLVEFDALRISHGFKPLEVAELASRSGDFQGYHIPRYRMLEVSVVSVPANDDAVITLASRSKLTHPFIKSWAGEKFRNRPTVVRSGYDGKGSAVQGAGDEFATCSKCGSLVKRPETVTQDYVPECPRCVAMRSGGFIAKGLAAEPLRWNTQASKAFDVASEKLPPASKLLSWVSQYLETPMKDVYQTIIAVPGVRLGSFLTGLRIAQAAWTVDDVRSLSGDSETPPLHETIQLNSRAKDTFLVSGTEFLSSDECNVVVDRETTWGGMYLTFFAPFKQKRLVEKMIEDAWEWAHANNFLKGEAFAISGEFLTRTSEEWADLFLEPVNERALKRVVERMNAKGAAFPNYGMLLCGPPGTGKTLSGRILRNRAEATFIWVSARDFYRAGSFGGLSMAFDLAKELSPAIVFVEDVDNWLDSYTIDYLKTALDGMERSSGTLTVMTTNFPESLPAALTDRPGRFHDVLEFDLPAREVRRAMLAKWVPGIGAEQLDAAVKDTEGYSGAHVYHLAFFAKSLQESENVSVDESVKMAVKKIVEQRELINGLQLAGSRYRPSKELAAVLAKRGGPLAAKGAVPYKPTVKADDDEAWDGDAAVGRLRTWAGVDGDAPSAAAWKKYAGGFAWFDSDKSDALGSYKLPHHDVKDGKLVVVWKGVVAAMAALNGARGGADVGGDKERVYQHLAAHYKQFDQEPPKLGGKAMADEKCPKCGSPMKDGKCTNAKCGYTAEKCDGDKKPTKPADDGEGGDEQPKKSGAPAKKAPRLTSKKVMLMKDAQRLVMAAHDHDEMKDATISKPLLREAHAKMEAVMPKAKPDSDEDDDPNPEMDEDDMQGPNPGIKPMRGEDLAVTFLAEVMKGAVSWETLHDCQRVIADAIAEQESKAAAEAAA